MKLTKQDLEVWIEKQLIKWEPLIGSGHLWPMRFGMAMGLLENCLSDMSEEQLEVALGMVRRDLDRQPNYSADDSVEGTTGTPASAVLVNFKALSK